MNASMMDAPSKFFFSLEQKNGQRKVIYCLRADDGSDITETAGIRRQATCFYKELFKSDTVGDPELETEFLSDLLQNLEAAVETELHQSSFWLMREPVSHGSLLSSPSWAGATVAEALHTAGVTTLGALLELTGPDLKETTELQAHLGWRSKRNVERLLSHWSACLMGRERQLLRDHSQRVTSPCPEHPFPSLVIQPGSDQQQEVTLKTAETKALTGLMVRELNRQRLVCQSRSPWRAKLALGEEVRPEWRSFYKPPLSKKSKMAVYISRRKKVKDSVDCDVGLQLSRMIKARILIEDLEQL
ncbi:uncharacterized protein isoform X2 [Takifugu rubripes]|uniref:uncharacterized protein isoform X2 n=1 Tax=Takifugu rubripes TaxID=31033 RepID=UPI001146011D|nr:uncharacterized protein LOC115252759 isoform X2 [Takifugu rubripes]